ASCVLKFKYSPRSIGTPDIHSADIYPADVHSLAVARRATGSRSCGNPTAADGEQSLPLQGSDSAFPPSRPSGLWAEAHRTSVEARRPPSGGQSGCSRFRAQLAVEAAGAPVGVEQTEQVQRNERIGERGHEIIGSVVAVHDELANVAPRGAEHEERPADGGPQPEPAAEEHAQEAEDAPAAVVQADLELEHAALRPADELRRLIGEEDVGYETEQEGDGADVEHEGVEEENAQHVAPRPRAFGDGQVHERQHEAQEHHDDVDHVFPFSNSGGPTNFISAPWPNKHLREIHLVVVKKNFSVSFPSLNCSLFPVSFFIKPLFLPPPAHWGDLSGHSVWLL